MGDRTRVAKPHRGTSRRTRVCAPVVTSPADTMAMQGSAQALPARLAQIARTLESAFLGKDEVIRLLLIAVVAGEHAVLIGPPGTAKSALIRMFARLL